MLGHVGEMVGHTLMVLSLARSPVLTTLATILVLVLVVQNPTCLALDMQGPLSLLLVFLLLVVANTSPILCQSLLLLPCQIAKEKKTLTEPDVIESLQQEFDNWTHQVNQLSGAGPSHLAPDTVASVILPLLLTHQILDPGTTSKPPSITPDPNLPLPPPHTNTGPVTDTVPPNASPLVSPPLSVADSPNLVRSSAHHQSPPVAPVQPAVSDPLPTAPSPENTTIKFSRATPLHHPSDSEEDNTPISDLVKKLTPPSPSPTKATPTADTPSAHPDLTPNQKMWAKKLKQDPPKGDKKKYTWETKPKKPSSLSVKKNVSFAMNGVGSHFIGLASKSSAGLKAAALKSAPGSSPAQPIPLSDYENDNPTMPTPHIPVQPGPRRSLRVTNQADPAFTMSKAKKRKQASGSS